MPKRNRNTIRIPPSLKSTNVFQLLVRFIREVIQPVGGKALLVGGAVRDIILKIPPKDLDIEVYGVQPGTLDTSIRKFFAHAKIEAFPSFGVWQLPRLGLSFSIPRTEAQTGPKHTDVAVTLQPHATLKQASKRRDLTINSILLDPLSGELCDPYKGVLDIQHKILRPVSAKHFADDPVRAWRVVQHMGRTACTPTPGLTRLITGMSHTKALHDLSGPRVRMELDALLAKAVHTGPALLFAARTGLLSCGLPELNLSSEHLTQLIHLLDQPSTVQQTDRLTARWQLILASVPTEKAHGLVRRLQLAKNRPLASPAYK